MLWRNINVREKTSTTKTTLLRFFFKVLKKLLSETDSRIYEEKVQNLRMFLFFVPGSFWHIDVIAN